MGGPEMAPQPPHAGAEPAPRAGAAESFAGPEMAPQPPRAGAAESFAGPEMAPQPPHAGAAESSVAASGTVRPVLAVVKDLFFVARIRETARLANVPLTFARSPEEVEAGAAGARFLLVDLTGALDYDRVLRAAETAGAPVLGFTTHALARQTQPWHGRCARVVTKETLTAELPTLLREGVAR